MPDMRAVVQDEAALLDMAQTAKKLYVAFCSHQVLIDILFSGDQAALPGSIEPGIKNGIYRAGADGAQVLKNRITRPGDFSEIS